MRRPWLLAVVLALLAAGIVLYQQIAPRSHMLFPPRAANGVDYVLYVHVPDGCQLGGCPALYLLDGLAWLPTFARNADALYEDTRIPPVVIVGIGYRNAFDTGDLRKHDFTPAFGATPGETGGADAFLAVLRTEIIPYAEAHLPIAPNSGRGLAGHSYAGLFAAYTLARAPDLFDRAMLLSPALWYDDGKIFNVDFAPGPTRTVFLAADTPRGATRSDMARDTERFADLLTAQHFDVSRALIFGKSHNSMVDPAARQGLAALYGASDP